MFLIVSRVDLVDGDGDGNVDGGARLLELKAKGLVGGTASAPLRKSSCVVCSLFFLFPHHFPYFRNTKM